MQWKKQCTVLSVTLALACASLPAVAAWRTVGKVVATTRSGETVQLSTAGGAAVRISFINAQVVRVRMSPTGAFERDFSYAVGQPAAAVDAQVQVDEPGGKISMRTNAADSARVEVRTRPDVLISVFDANGSLVVADEPARPMAFDPATGAVETSKQRGATELYYGFGEKALPISRHQQFMTMWNTDAPRYPPGLDPLYQAIPFFIALRDGASYGLFFDNTWRTYFDMGKTDPARYTFGASGGELDYYVFAGGRARTPARVLGDYTALTGRMPLPPLWALGYQQSRYSYAPQARVEAIAQTFREKKIPADVIYLDIDYMDGYRDFTWSPKDFPAPEQLLAELRDRNFHVVTIVDPGIKVDDNYAIYRDGSARGVFVRDAAGGQLQARVWPGECAFPDFTDPAARAWFGSLYAKFLDQGVAGFWNDMNEPATFPPANANRPILVHDAGKTFPLDALHDGDGQHGTHARYHNVYGMQMARATFEGVSKLRPALRPFVLTRSGYAGVQRFAAVWTGDNLASWEHLAMTIPMLTDLSVSGVPFVGADVGGFNGDPSAELYTRWLQAAALTPLFRTHSAIDTPTREPWTYGADFERINRATIELRYRLLPYLYTLFAASEQRGAAVLRPLAFQYPRDVEASLVEDEFLLGRQLLVAPVVREGATARKVYFPRGDAWIDWWDGTRHDGGTFADVAAPLDRLPLFVRAGAGIPVQPVIQHTGEMRAAPLTIAIGAGSDGSSDVYQDSGEGHAYRSRASRTITVTQAGNRVTLAIPSAPRFQRVAAVELVGVESPPRSVRLDGKPARDVSYDARTRRARITLPDESVRQITWQP